MLLHGGSEAVGEDGRSVRAALAVPYDDAPLVEIEGLDPKPQPFGETKAASVEQVRDECIGPRIHGGKEAVCFLLRQDGGQAFGPVGPLDLANVPEGPVEHVVVQEDEGVV